MAKASNDRNPPFSHPQTTRYMAVVVVEMTPRGLSAAHPRGRRPFRGDLLGERQGIINFDPEVADGALDLGMSKKQLGRAQIASLAVGIWAALVRRI
jgi:hypothetical protein